MMAMLMAMLTSVLTSMLTCFVCLFAVELACQFSKTVTMEGGGTTADDRRVREEH
jgi:uncharacterized membrane protein